MTISYRWKISVARTPPMKPSIVSFHSGNIGRALSGVMLHDAGVIDWGASLGREGHKMLKIASGGQTGVDRAALDIACELGIAYRGWCPKGGWAEDLPHA